MGAGVYLVGVRHNVLTKYMGPVKKKPLLRTGTALLVSGNIYSDTDLRPMGFGRCQKGVGIYLGGLRPNALEKYWGPVRKKPLLRTRTVLIVSGNINSDDDPSPKGFRAFPEGCVDLLGRVFHKMLTKDWGPEKRSPS